MNFPSPSIATPFSFGNWLGSNLAAPSAPPRHLIWIGIVIKQSPRRASLLRPFIDIVKPDFDHEEASFSNRILLLGPYDDCTLDWSTMIDAGFLKASTLIPLIFF